VVKQVDAVELRVVVPFSSHNSWSLVPIWLPHLPACMCENSREEEAWRRRASGIKRAGRSGET
jgi:hypothetical protein